MTSWCNGKPVKGESEMIDFFSWLWSLLSDDWLDRANRAPRWRRVKGGA